jgi:ParB-like chromosome segregation protein Spo0J
VSGDVFEAWPVELVPLDTLTEHPENFREHDVGAIAHSIERWGVWRALVVQESTRHVLVGNGELKALRALNAPNAPVRWIDVDDDNARAILLADNWIPSRGRNMPEELRAVMEQLREERELFESTGADDEDFEDLVRDIAETEKPLDVKAPKPRTQKVECPECGHKFTVGGKP